MSTCVRTVRGALRLALLLAWLATSAHAAAVPERVDLTLDAAPLLDAVEALARQCRAGVIADPDCSDRLAGRVTWHLVKVPWDRALAMLADDHGLRVVLAGDHLQVTLATRSAPYPELTTVTYDLRVLTEALHDRKGPNLEPPAPQGSHIGPPTEPESKPEINEFIELVQKFVAPDAWKGEGVAISEYNGAVMVTQLPAVQQLIKAAFAQLERRRATQLVCRFYRLATPPAAAGATLDAAQWAGVAPTATLAEAALAHHGKRQHIASGHERLYVQDLDLNQFVHVPIVAALGTGIDLDLTATATIADVLVDLRLMATVDAQWPTREVSDDHGQVLGVITTPRLATDTSSDTRLIPPGGAAIYRCGTRAYALTCEVLSDAGGQPFGPWHADGTIGDKPAPAADLAPTPAGRAVSGNPGNF
jgi:hypothetical protein